MVKTAHPGHTSSLPAFLTFLTLFFFFPHGTEFITLKLPYCVSLDDSFVLLLSLQFPDTSQASGREWALDEQLLSKGQAKQM